jgi:hypothetical protein
MMSDKGMDPQLVDTRHTFPEGPTFLACLGQEAGVLQHLARRRVRLRAAAIRNPGVLRSSSHIETRNVFMLPVALKDVADDVVGNDVGNGLHEDDRRKEDLVRTNKDPTR